jgi:hypothetical protein
VTASTIRAKTPQRTSFGESIQSERCCGEGHHLIRYRIRLWSPARSEKSIWFCCLRRPAYSTTSYLPSAEPTKSRCIKSGNRTVACRPSPGSLLLQQNYVLVSVTFALKLYKQSLIHSTSKTTSSFRTTTWSPSGKRRIQMALPVCLSYQRKGHPIPPLASR